MANSPAHPEIDAKLDPHLDNERRYMALLALTSQELPTQPDRTSLWEGIDLAKLSSEEWDSLYRQLDANPAALETFLYRERYPIATSDQPATMPARSTHWLDWSAVRNGAGEFIDWVTGPRVRYAAAFSVAVVVAALAVWQQFSHSSLATTVEQSFADSIFPVDKSLALVLPWEHAQATLGFAAAPHSDSERARAFAGGLLRGKLRLLPNSAATTAAAVTRGSSSFASYEALGEWNVLLWAACESEAIPPQEFWRRQEAVARELAAADFPEAAIAKHVTSTTHLLAALAGGENAKRNARRLAAELARFREELAPSDPTFITDTR